MHDQRDHREYQQQMYEAAGYVKQSETTNPRDQQNNEKNGPDSHIFFPSLVEFSQYTLLPLLPWRTPASNIELSPKIDRDKT